MKTWKRIFIVLSCLLFVLPAVKSQVLEQDSLALVALYHVTDPSYQPVDSLWLTGPVGGWKGVKVAGNRVVGLKYNNKEILTLPDEFCGLQALVSLDLSLNKLSGNFPACIASFTALQNLNLAYNLMTGAVPDFLATHLTQLHYLNLNGSYFTSLPDFSSMPFLIHLDVMGNCLSFEDLYPLLGKAGLTYLYDGQRKFFEKTLLVANLHESFTFPDVTIPGPGTTTYAWHSADHNSNIPITDTVSRFSGMYSPFLVIERVLPKDQFRRYFCKISNSEFPGMVIFTETVSLLIVDKRKLTIYELLTPNGDGDNETFFIDHMDETKNYVVTIFNGSHQVVYQKEKYNNDWNGGNLPMGMYYYLVKDSDGKQHNGKLYIKR